MLFWSVYISLRDAVLISASHCVETSGSRMCFISTGKFELVRNLCVLYFGLKNRLVVSARSGFRFLRMKHLNLVLWNNLCTCKL